NSISGEGYFEDELVMAINSTRNLARRPVRLITNRRPTEKKVPAIIVGAGPSRDKSLPYLAALRDGAVVFSAGTTIGTLMRRGIV
ncbi:6-hydroxymethylpterin diphosphokinase MptE-like protein, partial [Acinetobacter baumannii]